VITLVGHGSPIDGKNLDIGHSRALCCLTYSNFFYPDDKVHLFASIRDHRLYDNHCVKDGNDGLQGHLR